MRFKTFVGLLIVGFIVLVGWGVASCTHHAAPAPTPTPPPTAATATAPPPANNGSVQPLRPLDRKVLALLDKPLTQDNKNALPGEAWQVRLYREKTQPKVGHLKISFHHDGKWDEKWEIKWLKGTPHVTREVSPGRDQNFSEKYRLEGDNWVLK